jgi:hypothetical protein
VLQRIIGDIDHNPAQAAAVYGDRDGLLRGAVTVNWPKALMMCRRMIGAGATVAACLAELEGLPRLAAVNTAGR